MVRAGIRYDAAGRRRVDDRAAVADRRRHRPAAPAPCALSGAKRAFAYAPITSTVMNSTTNVAANNARRPARGGLMAHPRGSGPPGRVTGRRRRRRGRLARHHVRGLDGDELWLSHTAADEQHADQRDRRPRPSPGDGAGLR